MLNIKKLSEILNLLSLKHPIIEAIIFFVRTILTMGLFKKNSLTCSKMYFISLYSRKLEYIFID